MLIELRPCIVDDHKALFHGWTEKEYVVEASPLIGGAPAGQIKYLYGVVEYEDGTVHGYLMAHSFWRNLDKEMSLVRFMMSELQKLLKQCLLVLL